MSELLTSTEVNSKCVSRLLTVAVLIVLSLAATVHSQAARSELIGEVRDQNGALVANLKVSATDIATRQTTSMASSDGTFILTNLRPGVYNVAVEAAGFKQSLREGVRLATGKRVRLDVVLDPGAVTELVTVVRDASLLRTETGGLGASYYESKDRRYSAQRSKFSFVGYVIGRRGPTAPTTAGPSFPRINGGRPRVNEYLFDGISVLQPEPGQVAFFPIVEAIQEFKVEVNSPPAEFGRFNGGVVNLTTKSGTNDFHGSAFEFLRNEALNARNLFAPASAASPKKPVFRRTHSIRSPRSC